MKLPAVIGASIRRLREDYGRRQEDVAAAARGCGFEWGGSTIANLEAGRRQLSAEELLMLPLILQVGLGLDELVPLSLLLRGPVEWVEVTPQARVKPMAAIDLVTGARPRINPNGLDLPMTRQTTRVREQWLSRVKELRAVWPTTQRNIARALDGAGGEAERKAARKLGVPPEYVAVAAHRLWGRGLTAERDRRVADGADGEDARTVQALRGHVTRQLLDEIRPLVAKEA